ncbi:putative fluoride ion transporter CrcB [Beijerinckiaceae bacterium RH AL1]|nr:fluoride efflux transporter CrcB [Beijerinckiaceae bacterium]VVB46934.1 putative fluoride ion transporter CrcB [Beijerinckiaceae bacterium RH CH11]VVB47017.1 putative fluoride ion transporter CrcB [Beijerinckiaceae bacterium RH AL8]VVC55632.1 putative fluoride ion transporter CrcB [Beijerinckiaceae bacterium RH AL1]
MLTYLYVALGGAIGSVARFALSGSIARAANEVFPWGTLIVNIIGCFTIGFFATLTGPGGRVPATPDARAFVMVGICGGFTTFSSFSLQTLTLARDGDMLRAGANIVASVLFCLIGAWLGVAAGTALNHVRG